MVPVLLSRVTFLASTNEEGTGMIISFPVEITSDDPASEINKALLPGGYLRCDGKVLFAVEYVV